MKLKALALVAMIAGVAALTGCETMSAEECAVADWRTLGFQDAAERGASRYNPRAESCAERGVTADLAAYNTGFDAGMYQFCRPENGFAFARGGGGFNGVCPAELSRDFNLAYQDGQRVRAAEQALQTARSQVSSLTTRRDGIDHDLRSRENGLRDPSSSEEDRRYFRNEIDRLQRERRNVNDDIRTAQAQIPYLQRAVDDLRYELGDRWGRW